VIGIVSYAQHERSGSKVNGNQHHEKHRGWVVVCRLDDIIPNTGVCALVGGRQVAVFRLDDDRVYAIDNNDPFSRANVLSRGIVGDLKGELVVASPVYKQHFSLVSGQCLEDPEVRLAVFPARIEGDAVLVQA
jgi:nitrite reductase (NADH) small subunit